MHCAQLSLCLRTHPCATRCTRALHLSSYCTLVEDTKCRNMACSPKSDIVRICARSSKWIVLSKRMPHRKHEAELESHWMHIRETQLSFKLELKSEQSEKCNASEAVAVGSRAVLVLARAAHGVSSLTAARSITPRLQVRATKQLPCDPTIELRSPGAHETVSVVVYFEQ